MVDPLALPSALPSSLSQVTLELLSLLLLVVAQDRRSYFAAWSVLWLEPGMLHFLTEGLPCSGLSNQPSPGQLFQLLFPGSFVKKHWLQTL